MVKHSDLFTTFDTPASANSVFMPRNKIKEENEGASMSFDWELVEDNEHDQDGHRERLAKGLQTSSQPAPPTLEGRLNLELLQC